MSPSILCPRIALPSLRSGLVALLLLTALVLAGCGGGGGGSGGGGGGGDSAGSSSNFGNCGDSNACFDAFSSVSSATNTAINAAKVQGSGTGTSGCYPFSISGTNPDYTVVLAPASCAYAPGSGTSITISGTVTAVLTATTSFHFSSPALVMVGTVHSTPVNFSCAIDVDYNGNYDGTVCGTHVFDSP